MRTAFAQIGRQRLSGLLLGRALGGREERGRLHDHAIDAVATLGCLFVDEFLLQRMRFSAVPEAFQGHDFGAGYGRDRHDAGRSGSP